VPPRKGLSLSGLAQGMRVVRCDKDLTRPPARFLGKLVAEVQAAGTVWEVPR
jgi:hypothetical protein